MIPMIGKGVTSGHRHVDRSLRIRRDLCARRRRARVSRAHRRRSIVRLFVRSASMAGSILFIVAAASSVSFALTIEQIPAHLSRFDDRTSRITTARRSSWLSRRC